MEVTIKIEVDVEKLDIKRDDLILVRIKEDYPDSNFLKALEQAGVQLDCVFVVVPLGTGIEVLTKERLADLGYYPRPDDGEGWKNPVQPR